MHLYIGGWLLSLVNAYVQAEEEGSGKAYYDGRFDWAPDPDSDSDSES
jgi:hypothetical protein